MDMTNQILPFYNSPLKQEKARYNTNEVRYCTRHHLPPFLVKRAHSASNTVLTSAYLVDTCGTETDITSYFRDTVYAITSWSNYTGTYSPTFTATGGAIVIVDTLAGGTALSNTFSVVSGKTYWVRCYLTLNSGEAPTISLGDPTVRSNQVVLANGYNNVLLTATGTGTYSLMLTNSGSTNFSLGTPAVSISLIATFYNYTSVDYWQYNGGTLIGILPKGRYYLRLTDGVSKWYSEWFDVVDVYPNKISDWTNSGTHPFETWATSGTTITVANTSGTGRAYGTAFEVKAGDVVTVIFDLTLITGTLPDVIGYETPGAAVIASGTTCVAGLNVITLTMTKSTMLTVGINVTANSSFYTGEVFVLRESPDYSRVTFTNSVDISDILYQHSFVQEVFLKTKLLKADPKQVLVGDERNGVFIPESVVTLPVYKLIDWMGPEMMKVMKMIPGHGTVTVTDDLLNTYSPDNIELNVEQVGYDVFKVEFSFTDNEVVNTLNQTNIT